MAHIAQVGRNAPRVRAGVAVLYALLILGAVTTVYPFLLMISVATKSQTDYNDFTPKALLPRYWYDDDLLFAKYAEDRYANNIDAVNAAYDTDFAKPADVVPPNVDINGPGDREKIRLWNTFLRTLPPDYFQIGFGEHDNAPSPLLLRFRARLRKDFDDDITRLNREWTEENVSFDGVVPPFERTILREWTPDLSLPKVRYWYEFRKSLPENYRVPTRIDALYRTYLRQNVYEDKIARLNAAWGTQFTDWAQIALPRALPQGNSGTDWETFVRTKLPLRMIGLNQTTLLPPWREFLAKRGRAGAATASLRVGVPNGGQARTDWMEFIATDAPLSALTVNSTENLWRQYAGSNGLSDLTAPPQRDADWRFVRDNAAALRWDFATRNFRAVTGYILLHGRAVWNTLFYCVLAILGAIIINPMCAYALSRYPLAYGYQVLIFVLATMAFPAEVAMIPNFLLLKELNLLNTFYALLLPGLASGFSIFLLKGFFDSLPKELYEAATIDGASEIKMFGRITVPLSLPIFSVIALNAFTAAYGSFLFAMVVCQDPKMWTLMVWLYDLQDKAPQYVIMAALTLAALPTLLVFLAAQKVILRGIILPSFK